MKNLKTILLATVFTFGLHLKMSAAETAKPEAKPEAKPSYPLTTCVVSGEKLGEMGQPYVHTYEGREVKFCCKGCVKDFNKDPKKYVAKLDAAVAAAAKK
ncbi:MAG: hypothetical protein RLZZ350_1336 [Verrucomicrobiota bacterium]|jgi:YHS domain-containing protein